MAARKRIGQVGCGNWGKNILRDLVQLGCAVHVVARSSGSRARAAAAGAASIVAADGDLPEVDGLVVATPTVTHGSVIERLLPRGVPLFVEKPMTADVASARRIVARAASRVFVMDKWRYHAGVEALAAIARSGELGPVQGIRTLRLGWGIPHTDANANWHLMPHDLSVGLEILGRLPPLRHAWLETVAGEVTGCIARLGDHPWLVVEVSVRRTGYQREIQLHCQGGTATLRDGYADALTIARPNEREPMNPHLESRPVAMELPLLRELRAFVEHLEGGPPPRSSALEGLAVVEIITAIHQGAAAARAA
jgi:predicted dehydrogenase